MIDRQLINAFKKKILMSKKNMITNADLDNNDDKSLNHNLTGDQMFHNFRLRRIVKENHGQNINQISFFFNLKNYEAPIGPDYIKKYNKYGHIVRDVNDTSNILATVADAQVRYHFSKNCNIIRTCK